MIKGKPLFERLIVREIPVPDMTKGGILLPEQTKEVPNTGVIMAIGHTALLDKDGIDDPDLLKEGDVVLYTKYAGLPFRYKGIDYKVIMINEVIWVYDDDDGDEIKSETDIEF